MKYIFSILIFLFVGLLAIAQLPQVSSGVVKRHESFPSTFVNARTVDVWLPPAYNPSLKYAVLYMHDGQMLFDSTTTWNKQEWGVDETMASLIRNRQVMPCIVVGIWNSGSTRHIDYFPQRPFESLSPSQQDSIYSANRSNGQSVFSGKVQSDNYLKFLVTELKPFIDQTYSTYTDYKHTFIAGSSMGGLISMYAICEYPNVFGGAACLSTHWPGIFQVENNPIPSAFFNYLKVKLPNPKNHKIYFDYGTATLDAFYPPLQKQVDRIMQQKGYHGSSWVTKEFVGEEHSEKAWKKRLSTPVLFLLSAK